jgi:hypothetical protein
LFWIRVRIDKPRRSTTQSSGLATLQILRKTIPLRMQKWLVRGAAQLPAVEFGGAGYVFQTAQFQKIRASNVLAHCD